MPPRLAEGLDHRLGRLLAAAIVVAGDMRNDFGPFREAGNIGGKHGDAFAVGFLDHGANRPAVAGAKDDRGAPGRNKIADLLVLLGDVEFAGDDGGFIAGLFQFSLEIVADDLEERVGHRQHRDADGALGGRGGGFRGGAAERDNDERRQEQAKQ